MKLYKRRFTNFHTLKTKSNFHQNIKKLYNINK